MKIKLARLMPKVLSALLVVALLIGICPGVRVYAAENEISFSVNENLANHVQNNVKIPAGQTVSFDVGSAAFFHLIIQSDDITVTFNGKDHDSKNGEVNVFLAKNALSVQFDITNHSSADKTLTLRFSRHDGHKKKPIEIETMADFVVEQKAQYCNNLDIGTFYRWVAPADGALKMEVTDIETASSGMKPRIIINDDAVFEDGIVNMNVKKGEELDILIAATLYGVAFDADIYVDAAFVEGGEAPPVTEPPVTEPPVTEPPITEPDHECYVNGFKDVNPEAWYHEPLDFMVGKGYMNGMKDDEMAPNGNLTRAQWAKILYEVEGEPSVAGLHEPFEDVKEDQWFYEAIVWAYNEGIVNGVSDTTFGHGDNITREQMATMLYRYAGLLQVTGDLSEFPDSDTVTAYAVDAMIWATQNGIINGMGKGELVPRGFATRAQAAKILFAYLQ